MAIIQNSETMRVVCDSIDFSFEVPFNILNEDQAQINHSQTLKRLNERGGMSPMELIANIEKKSFIQMKLEHDIYDKKYYLNKLKILLNM